jgi:hypothetical protein
MLDGLISNIFVLFGGLVYQQTTGIPIGINCASFKGFSRIKIENYLNTCNSSSAI